MINAQSALQLWDQYAADEELGTFNVLSSTPPPSRHNALFVFPVQRFFTTVSVAEMNPLRSLKS